MPALPFTNQVFKVRMLGVAQGQNIDNVLHASYGGGPALVSDCNNVATLFASSWNTYMCPYLHTSYSLTSVVVQDLTSATAAQGSWSGSHAGTDASAVAPLSVCAVISWTIARRYRGGKPRTYLGPVASNTSTAGKLIPTGQATSIASSAETFRTTIDAYVGGTLTALDLGCVSYYTGKVLRAAGLFEGFTSGTNVDLRLGSQRRRLGKLSAVREI